jgi:hypothetical protein
VEAVKTTLSPNRNFTIGEILDQRTFCDSAKWEDSKNDAGDTIVTYSCQATLDQAVMEKAKKVHQGAVSYFVKSIQASVDREQERIAKEHVQRVSSFDEEVLTQKASEIGRLKDQLVNCGDRDQPYGGPCDKRMLTELIGQREENIRTLRQRIEETTTHNEQAAQEGEKAQKVFLERREVFLTKLKELEAQDMRAVESAYAKPAKVEQQAFFKVYQGEVRPSLGKSTVNDHVVANYAPFYQCSGGFALCAELRAPKGPDGKRQWDEYWAENTRLPVELKVKNLSEICEQRRDCMDGN